MMRSDISRAGAARSPPSRRWRSLARRHATRRRSCSRRRSRRHRPERARTRRRAPTRLYVGALGRLKTSITGGRRQEQLWLFGGLLTDEWQSSDTFSQRNDDRLSATMQTNNGSADADVHGAAAGARPRARRDQRLCARTTPTPTAQHRPRCIWSMGFRRDAASASDFCNGIPLGETRRRRAAVHGRRSRTPTSSTRRWRTLDSALACRRRPRTRSTVGASSRRCSSRKRPLPGRPGKFAEAAAAVASASRPTSSTARDFTQTVGRQSRSWSHWTPAPSATRWATASTSPGDHQERAFRSRRRRIRACR